MKAAAYKKPSEMAVSDVPGLEACFAACSIRIERRADTLTASSFHRCRHYSSGTPAQTRYIILINIQAK